VLADLEVRRAASAPEACRILAESDGEARLYAGGTELLLVLKLGMARCGTLVDLKHSGLGGIDYLPEQSVVRIGATTTHRGVERSARLREFFPVLPEMARHIANVRVRATGTVGGNLAFAEPHSDLGSVAVLLGAIVRTMTPDGESLVPAEDFFADEFETCLGPCDVVTGIDLPIPAEPSYSAYEKWAFLERPSVTVGCEIRTSQDRAQVTAARVVVGSVEPVPTVVAEAGQLLVGAPVSDAAGLAREAGLAVRRACRPVDDEYGSAEYKSRLAEVLARRAVTSALRQSRGEAGDIA
jgi:aerobic carbon-monoxide dehydrogenase medium subunit